MLYKKCAEPACANNCAPPGDLCRVHGGGKRCTDDGCEKMDAGKGHCVSHGGGKRCQVPNCSKGATGGSYCVAHGGGKRCQQAGGGRGRIQPHPEHVSSTRCSVSASEIIVTP